MTAKRLAEIIYQYLDSTKKLDIDTLYPDRLTGQQIFIETKDRKKFQILIVPTEMEL